MPKNFKHDVDIRSSQIGNAAKDAKKFIGESLVGGIGLLVILCGFLFVKWQIEKAETSKEIMNSPRLNPSAVANDFVNNKMRYKQNWEYEWVKYSGRIDNIKDREIIIDAGWISTTNSRGQRASVYCKVASDKINDFAKFNRGDQINIVGNLWTSFDINAGMNGHWKFKLNQCMLS